MSVSSDNGLSWGVPVTLEDEDPETGEAAVELDRSRRANEFSYPAIVYYEGALHVCYTWKRERICYRRLPVVDLE